MKYSKNDIAGKIGVSAMSVTRATRELKKIGAIQEEKHGNEIFISCEKERNAVYSMIRPYLTDPVQSIIYINGTEIDRQAMIEAGEYSLSKRSKLGYPRYKEYALLKNSSFFDVVDESDPDLSTQRDLVRVQKWKYDPFILSNNGIVDPISLVCSLQDENDERIQMNLDDVLREVDTWQIMKN